MGESAVVAESIAVGDQHKSVIPPHELAPHLQDRTIGIHGTFLVEHGHGYLDRIDNDEPLAQYRHGDNVACKITGADVS